MTAPEVDESPRAPMHGVGGKLKRPAAHLLWGRHHACSAECADECEMSKYASKEACEADVLLEDAALAVGTPPGVSATVDNTFLRESASIPVYSEGLRASTVQESTDDDDFIVTLSRQVGKLRQENMGLKAQLKEAQATLHEIKVLLNKTVA